MSRRITYALTLALALAAGAGGAAALAVSVAAARTFALQIAPHALVTPQTGTPVREAIVVNPAGHAVYTLSSDSERHPACTSANGCWSFWPPARTTARHPAAAPGIRGKLTVWRHAGIRQLVLNGHPLYAFSVDKARDVAGGEGLNSFHGVWHVVRTSHSSSPVGTVTGTTTTGTTPTYTSTTPTYTYTTPTYTNAPSPGY
jgi:predicted lipoprotein with Yx(FWY)xxD motif